MTILNFEKNIKQFVRMYPITVIYVCVCILFSLLMMIVFNGYSEESLLRMGALSGNSIESGELWRFVTYSFGHMSLFHLVLNIPFLILLSRPLENYYGPFLYPVILILLSVLAGMSVEFVQSSNYPLAGSSGIAYGLIGIYIYYVIFNKDKLNQDDRRFITTFSAIGFIMTFTIPDISIIGHLGGFTFGLLLGFITDFMIKKEKRITN
ncbi:rhomboid family intramembrane serine protease [Alkalihalobacillus sp. LMS6]|uniref:rhomboid family intramembrane serine protease n=1 Tax=Alkalihalobacillus sp. LMS6 TaxID=2924034 RepID=UPI0020D005D1|nr:rhomboid family intramembrane serine protease [Alkalihalobacillus sp. LMS6]UTR06085.1 rhomboid family intramembrane serine protease [Alkalihalobacillus sp. LMS6]